MKEEFTALILYIKNNKAEDNDWFNIKPKDKSGTFWEGKCWNYYKGLKYEFKLQFAIPATYPAAAPELAVPELEGKTAKMYRGGKSAWIFTLIHCGKKMCLSLGLPMLLHSD